MKSGKWTEAEVSFAMQLIHEFENGIISGMSPKVTLRAFLRKSSVVTQCEYLKNLLVVALER